LKYLRMILFRQCDTQFSFLFVFLAWFFFSSSI